jgi:hypothetical protein
MNQILLNWFFILLCVSIMTVYILIAKKYNLGKIWHGIIGFCVAYFTFYFSKLCLFVVVGGPNISAVDHFSNIRLSLIYVAFCVLISGIIILIKLSVLYRKYKNANNSLVDSINEIGENVDL